MDLGDSRAIISGDGTGMTREKNNTVAFEFCMDVRDTFWRKTNEG
jgi:hypothetical protein